MLNFLLNTLRQYIFIISAATILLIVPYSKSFSEENIFVVDKVKVEGKVDINYSRNKYINKAFTESFEILMSKILVSSDLDKIKNIKLNKIKDLINSFQIIEEKYVKGKHEATFKIFYNERKIKNFLANKNISFSQPREIPAIFYPVLFVNDEVQSFSENFFYNKWQEIEIKNELIDFILPLEDLDDLSKIQEMRNKIEELNVTGIVNRYNSENYVFLFMYYKNKKLKTHIKLNFDNNKISQNITYEINNIKNEDKLSFILKDLKIKITDIWKEMNYLNLLMPLSITVKFKHSNIQDLDKLKNVLKKIKIIDNYTLEKFNIDNSFFKIYYYGNPKRLSSELFKFGYGLNNNQSHWELLAND